MTEKQSGLEKQPSAEVFATRSAPTSGNPIELPEGPIQGGHFSDCTLMSLSDEDDIEDYYCDCLDWSP